MSREDDGGANSTTKMVISLIEIREYWISLALFGIVKGRVSKCYIYMILIFSYNFYLLETLKLVFNCFYYSTVVL